MLQNPKQTCENDFLQSTIQLFDLLRAKEVWFLVMQDFSCARMTVFAY